MTQQTAEQKLNPQIAELEVGVRNLRTIRIYPFAVASETKATELISETVNTIAGLTEEQFQDLTVMVSLFIETFQKHAGAIIGMSTDEDEKLLENITNDQLIAFGKILYDQNFKQISKNLPDLWRRVKAFTGRNEETPSSDQRSLQPSAPPTQGTDLNISQD